MNTKDACGAVAVDQDGMVYELDTAPIYRWAARKKYTFQTFRQILLKKGVLISVKKLEVDIDPF